MKRVLVTGAGGAPASNFINCLRMAEERLYIVGCDSNSYHLELAAGLDARYLIPHAHDRDYTKKINQLIEAERIDFLHAQPDVEVLRIARDREQIGAATLLPSTSTVEHCQDKMWLNRRLTEAGVPCPRAFHLSSRADLDSAFAALAGEGSSGDRAWIRAIRGAGARASLPIFDIEQGRQWVSYWKSAKDLAYPDFMVSEFLPGREYAFQSIWMDGEMITSQARERIEYLFGDLTPSGQTSSPAVARTVHDERVNEAAIRAVQCADEKASGIFCVDLKEDHRGVPCVTEINCGRFFTTSNFLAEAGSNMPYYYLKMAFGEELPPLPRVNATPADLYWIRLIDMGFKLVRNEEWSTKKI